jgi:carboxypeptidase Taq
MKTAQVRAVFDRIKPTLVDLAASADRGEPEPFFRGPYTREAQHAISLEVMRAFGADDASFRLDPSVHPFCTSFTVTDVRLTTRYAEDDLTGHSLFSAMHETGHGLYERGVDPVLGRSPLAHGCSSALHESQSRLWENVIGRSLPFWRWFYPRLQEAHPDVLGDVPLERFHRAVNGVRPGFVRVDADEATYGLHIILRFEIEQELLEGRLAPADVPEAWNSRVADYLGLTVTDDRLGCLQDVHWSFGGFGYFPTYQLGNVLSVQVWQRLCAEVGDTDALLERGDFAPILGWLTENLYALGRRFPPAETIERVTGGAIDAEPYLAYLQAKFATR